MVMQFSNALMDLNLCVSEKHAELIAWGGRVFELDEDFSPPEDIAGALWLAGLRGSATLVSRVSHVKVTAESDDL